MTFLRSTNRWVLKGCETLLIFLILSMVFLGFGQVVLRKLGVHSLSKLLTEIPSILQHFVLWVAVLGAAIATSRRKHIKIDILAQVLPKGRQMWLYAVTDFSGLIICILLTKGGLSFFKIAEGEAFVWRSALVIGFGIIGLQFLVNLLGAFFPERPADDSIETDSDEEVAKPNEETAKPDQQSAESESQEQKAEEVTKPLEETAKEEPGAGKLEKENDHGKEAKT
ncbi:MAG: TRAP transporter small permease subunit [Planctomycetota bacterium]|nr:TRAP transporter small permease subunit [Planctomycetota bacterium]MDA1138025.1 TRAP transporter small permease subunit [Planctomycetota bacterium]